MAVIRSALGKIDRGRPPEYERIEQRLDEQTARLRRLDAQLQAEMAGQAPRKRRSTDR